MIACIQGRVKMILSDQEILLVANAIGYHICVPESNLFVLEEEAVIHTFLHWSQEAGPTLYGFIKREEKLLFQLMIQCSGLGPKLGLTILATLGMARFITSVSTEDKGALSAVPGIGNKKAARIILHLQEKVDAFSQQYPEVSTAGGDAQLLHTVAQALGALDYRREEVAAALAHVKKEEEVSNSFDVVMRRALLFLAKRRG